jgi:hypothetical protein
MLTDSLVNKNLPDDTTTSPEKIEEQRKKARVCLAGISLQPWHLLVLSGEARHHFVAIPHYRIGHIPPATGPDSSRGAICKPNCHFSRPTRSGYVQIVPGPNSSGVLSFGAKNNP